MQNARCCTACMQAAVYGGTYELVHHELVSLGIAISVIDQTDPETWRAALRPNTKVLLYWKACTLLHAWLSNPSKVYILPFMDLTWT